MQGVYVQPGAAEGLSDLRVNEPREKEAERGAGGGAAQLPRAKEKVGTGRLKRVGKIVPRFFPPGDLAIFANFRKFCGAGGAAQLPRTKETTHPPPSNINFQPSTLNPQPSTLNPQP